MEVVREARRNFKEFIVRLFIDSLLLFVRLIDSFYGVKQLPRIEKSQETAKKRDVTPSPPAQSAPASSAPTPSTPASSTTRDAESRDGRIEAERSGSQCMTSTDGVDSGKSTPFMHDDGNEAEAVFTRIKRMEGDGKQRDHGRNMSCVSDTVDELPESPMTGSMNRDVRHMSALSDYYSDEDDISREWKNSLARDDDIADGLAAAESIERGAICPKEMGVAYDRVCKGVDKLHQVSTRIMDDWKSLNAEDAAGGGETATVAWQRSSIRLDASTRHQEELSLSNLSSSRSPGAGGRGAAGGRVPWGRRQTPEESRLSWGDSPCGDSPGNLRKRRMESMNQRMLEESTKAKRIETYLEKKKVELGGRMNDERLKELKGCCEDLFLQQQLLCGECVGLKNHLDRRRDEDIEEETGILRTTLAELNGCLQAETEKAKVWSMEKSRKCDKIQAAAENMARHFEERKQEWTIIECESFVTTAAELQEQLHSTCTGFLDDWKDLGERAEELLAKRLAGEEEEDKRRMRWKDFQAVDEFQEKMEKHLRCYEDCVPEICSLYDQRAIGSKGIFGSWTQSPEFRRFNQRYEQKLKELRESFGCLERTRAECCRSIKVYSELYEKLSDAARAQQQHDQKLKELETRTRHISNMLIDMEEAIRCHVINKQGNEVLAEKTKVERFLLMVEEELKKHIKVSVNQIATRSNFERIVGEILEAEVLQRHVKKLEDFAKDWEEEKEFEKIFFVIQQIENFDLIEDPLRKEFGCHEELVTYLEKRLPAVAGIHEENGRLRLVEWTTTSEEYSPAEQEPMGFGEMEQQFNEIRVYTTKCLNHLVQLERKYLELRQRLVREDGSLTRLRAQGFEAPSTEHSSPDDRLIQALFLEARRVLLTADEGLVSFEPKFNRYSDLNCRRRELNEILDQECYNSKRLEEKLSVCEALLRRHRDHLERRRIEEKLEMIAAKLENTSSSAELGEQRHKKLAAESETLKRLFVQLCPQHLSDVTGLNRQIPKQALLDLFQRIFNYEQNLASAEDKISKCQESLAKEENTIFQYYSLVQNMDDFLKTAHENLTLNGSVLKSIESELPVYVTFIQGHERQEKVYSDDLAASRDSQGRFQAEFSSTKTDFEELVEVIELYNTQYITDESGERFGEMANQRSEEISAELEELERRLSRVETGNRAVEKEVAKLLDDGKAKLDGIRSYRESTGKELGRQWTVHAKIQSELGEMGSKGEERRKRADEVKRRLQAENYERHCEMEEQKNPLENQEPFKCPRCSKETKPQDGIVLRDCLHQFCKNCLGKYIRDLKTAEAPCPGTAESPSCCGVILDKEIRCFGKDVYEKHVERGLSQLGEGAGRRRGGGGGGEDLVFCWNLNCLRVVGFQGRPLCDTGSFPCPHCGVRNCKECKVAHDGKETCDAYRKSLPYRQIAESVKCQICLAKNINMAFVPCGHVICDECVGKHRRPPAPFLCPFCRKKVDSSQKLYLLLDNEEPTNK